MVSKSRSFASCALIGIAFGLAGCGGGDGTPASSTNDASAMSAGQAGAEKAAVPALMLAEGPDVCFKAIAKKIGADTKVSEINSFFSSGNEIDSNDDEPKGQLTTCSVEYQSPDDARKLVSISMDMNTGEFSAPRPVEISVSGGDASAFKLDDYLIPLSKVNAAGLAAIMQAQAAPMAAVFSKYAWSGVRLSSPGPFSDVHTLRLDVDGRLATNDIKESGYASISTDGKTITTNNLKP